MRQPRRKRRFCSSWTIIEELPPEPKAWIMLAARSMAAACSTAARSSAWCIWKSAFCALVTMSSATEAGVAVSAVSGRR